MLWILIFTVPLGVVAWMIKEIHDAPVIEDDETEEMA